MTGFAAATPILRIFDETKARAFYVDFLGFAVLFEHRFGDDFPLYMSVRRGDCELHLSEHHGDATPGAHVRIRVDDVDALVGELASRADRYAKPGAAEETPWGTREITLTDPFGARLTFFRTP